MAFVSVTRLRLRSPLLLPAFYWHAILTFTQANKAPGNLFSQTQRDRLAFWTLTVWQDEAFMRQYMSSGAHRKAMPKLAQWCDEASVTHWTQDTSEPPRWEEAKRRMAENGRLSPLKHPSSNHAAGIIQP